MTDKDILFFKIFAVAVAVVFIIDIIHRTINFFTLLQHVPVALGYKSPGDNPIVPHGQPIRFKEIRDSIGPYTKGISFELMYLFSWLHFTIFPEEFVFNTHVVIVLIKIMVLTFLVIGVIYNSLMIRLYKGWLRFNDRKSNKVALREIPAYKILKFFCVILIPVMIYLLIP